MSKSLFISALMLFLPVLQANDGAAGLSGGSLVFKNLQGVSMEKEVLHISQEQVSVSYIFANTTQNDIETLVAFPIDYVENCGDKNYDPDAKNPLNFTARVNGKDTRFEHRKEITNKDTCGEPDRRSTFYWKQVFKANSKTTVEHSYTPIYDSSILDLMPIESDKTWDEYYGRDLVKHFCASKNQAGWLRKKRRRYKHLNYILKTANTWDGPIGHFELNIHKGKSRRVFLCTDLDLVKINKSNSFRAIVKKYRPESNLNIAFTY